MSRRSQNQTPSPLFLAALEEQRRQEVLRARIQPSRTSPQPPLLPPRGYVFDSTRNRLFRIPQGEGEGGSIQSLLKNETYDTIIDSKSLSLLSNTKEKKNFSSVTRALQFREKLGNQINLPSTIQSIQSRVVRGVSGRGGISALAITNFSLPFTSSESRSPYPIPSSTPLVALATDSPNTFSIGTLDRGVSQWIPPKIFGQGESPIRTMSFAPLPVVITNESQGGRGGVGQPASPVALLALGTLGYREEPGAVHVIVAHHRTECLATIHVTRGSTGGRSTKGGSLWSCSWVIQENVALPTISSSSSSFLSLSYVRLVYGASAGEDSALVRIRSDGKCLTESICVLNSDAFCCANDSLHGQIVFGTRSGSIVSWDARSPSYEARRLTQLTSSVLSINPLKDEEGLWLLGDAGTHLELRDSRVWDRGSVYEIPGYDNSVVKHSLGVSTCLPTSGIRKSTIAVCCRGNKLRLWDSRAKLIREITTNDMGRDWSPSLTAFAPHRTDDRGIGWGRNRIITASKDKLVEIYEQRDK